MDKNQKTTGFTNIQDIVRSNRNNRLGKTVQSGVQNVIGQGQNQLQGAQQQFQQGAQQNQIGTAADQAYVNQTVQNPTNVQQQDVDRFANLRSGQYRGPTQLGNREELGARGQELQGIAGSATSEQGRRGLLQRFVAPQQQYTQGQQRLDNLLLGQTGGQATRNARQGANQFNQQLLSADQAAQGQGQAYTQQARQFGDTVNTQLGQAQTDQQKQLQDRAAEQTKGSEAARKALYALFSKATSSTPNTTPNDQYSTMPIGQGQTRPTISQEEYDAALPLLQNASITNRNIYGADKYYQPADPNTIIGDMSTSLAANPNQVATQEDQARAAGLSKLFGKPQEFLTGQVGGYDPMSFLQQDNLGKYFTENEAKNTFDPSSINSPSKNILGGASGAKYLEQGQAIQNLAKYAQETDPAKAAKYQELANRLINYGNNPKDNYLWGYEDKPRFESLYNQILNSGLGNRYENNKTTLLDRLKGLIR